MKKIVSFPHMGNYYIAFKEIASILGCEILLPPKITKKTLEIGNKYSPEFVCIPFKYNLGNYIQSVEAGANLLIQSGGGCRFRLYGLLHEQIIKDLGYECEFFTILKTGKMVDLYADIKKINPKITISKFLKGFYMAYFKTQLLDHIERLVRLDVGFEVNDGDFEKLYDKFLKELDGCKTLFGLLKIKSNYEKLLKKIPLRNMDKKIKIGIVGELYVLMEPFSNFFIEKQLAKHGVQVYRFVTLSTIIHEFIFKNHYKTHLKSSKKYLKYHLGAHGTESVAKTLELIEQGFDGVIHIKPFGCMPEVNAMSPLQKIAQDCKFPIMFMSFDSQTSETGIKTRLEAFYDMLVHKRYGTYSI